jgi:glycine cleavage system H protein
VNERTRIAIGSYQLEASRYYEAENHIWVEPDSDGNVRCGFDPLAAETAGDIVAVSFEKLGTAVERGRSFGNLEAAKFVGPLLAPVSGTIRAHNDSVISNPALLNSDPQVHWMVEIEPSSLTEELPLLLHGEQAVRSWFEHELRRVEEKGLLAE